MGLVDLPEFRFEVGALLKETTGGEFRVFRASTRLL